MMSTVVTNFRRPEFLARAIYSLAAAKVENVVISSCGVTPEVEEVHRISRRVIKNLSVISEAQDIDCNDCWLSGVRECRTPYVHILHDDDVVDRDFGSVTGHLDGRIDFVLCDAFFQTESYEIPSQPFMHAPILGAPRGENPSGAVLPRLLGRGNFSLSPINGIFRKEVAVEALEESSRAFSGASWHVRPTMMVGNDLLLWIRSCIKAKVFYYDNRPLVGYGLHGGSTTVEHMGSGRSGVLTGIYDQVRDYVKGHP